MKKAFFEINAERKLSAEHTHYSFPRIDHLVLATDPKDRSGHQLWLALGTEQELLELAGDPRARPLSPQEAEALGKDWTGGAFSLEPLDLTNLLVVKT